MLQILRKKPVLRQPGGITISLADTRARQKRMNQFHASLTQVHPYGRGLLLPLYKTAVTLHLYNLALFTVKTPFSTIKKQCK